MEQEESKLIDSNNKLRNLKSDYFIQKFFGYMSKRKSLETIRYNKSIQKRINININHYKSYSEEYSSIEFDIIPMKGEYGKFINIKEEDKKYFHIYFNDNKKEEIENTSLNKDDNVSKISIIVDYQIKSFSILFFDCWSVESIKFKKFYRNNVTDMSDMFWGCSSLKELNLNNFNPLASPSAGAPTLNYGDVNTVTPSPGEAKGLICCNSLIIPSTIFQE